MKNEDSNPLLNDLFAQARAEVPHHSYADTKKTLLAGLAIGGAGLLGAKFITSSIIKSKLFMMSISAITILSSAAFVYTLAVNPTEPAAKTADNGQVTFAVEAPNNKEVPDNFFSLTDTEVEPDDTLVRSLKDSIVPITEIIDEVISNIKMDDSVMISVTETMSSFGMSIDEDALLALQQVLINVEDSLQLEQLAAMINQLEMQDAALIEQIDNIQFPEPPLPPVIKLKQTAPTETRQVFTITDKTTDVELEAFNKQATAAGITVRYTCKVWKGFIKKLDMHLEINTPDNQQKSDIKIKKSGKNDKFVQNIVWYENEQGQAIKFNTSND